MNVFIPEELRYFSDASYVDVPASVDKYPYFLYELQSEQTPWLEDGNGLSLLKPAWERLESALEAKQRLRNKEVKEEVDALLALFFMALFWSNEQPAAPVLWKEKEVDFAVKPINFRERFEYITKRPYTYMAYRQLLELMTELKKAAAVHAIRKNPR